MLLPPENEGLESEDVVLTKNWKLDRTRPMLNPFRAPNLTQSLASEGLEDVAEDGGESEVADDGWNRR